MKAYIYLPTINVSNLSATPTPCGQIVRIYKNGHMLKLAILRMRSILVSTVRILIRKTIGKSDFVSKNSDFYETNEAFYCFVLISRKWENYT